MTSEELNTILGRGICYPKIEKAHRILVTGMNPSFRQGDPAREDFVCEYEYQGIVEGGEDICYTCKILYLSRITLLIFHLIH